MSLAHPLALSAILLGIFAAGGASADGASALGLSANFDTDGVFTALHPANPVSSGTASNYDKTKSLGSYGKTLILTADGPAPPTLTVDTLTQRSSVKGGFGVDTISAQGAASVASLNLKLAPYTPPNSDVVAAPYLQIIVTKARESADYDYVAPSHATASSSGTIDTLTVTGPLVGGKTLTFSGSPKVDTVLYQSPTVTITLNQKITTALISCTPKCLFTPESISAAAIDVTLNNAKLGKHTVSGDISIASGAAGRLSPN
jgi:hypothetical protein